MTRFFRLAIPVAAVAIALPLAAWQAPSADERAIRDHIERTYFAASSTANADAARGAFHPVLVMYSAKDGVLAPLTRDQWIERVTRRTTPPPGVADNVKRRILNVDVHGTIAMAKVAHELPNGEMTDYLSLVKVGGEWAVVAKVFDRQERGT